MVNCEIKNVKHGGACYILNERTQQHMYQFLDLVSQNTFLSNGVQSRLALFSAISIRLLSGTAIES
jgi:hypothetical protein